MYGHQLIYNAICCKDIRKLREFLDNSAYISKPSNYYMGYAIDYDSIDMVRILIEYKINMRPQAGSNLHNAADKGNADIVRALLNY